ncbi:MAG TPA: deoxyribonuclease IV [Bryobacteraceae bacterium]|nr:deoxyribonuclease IV [Bryobacteraceae bacterium]
MRIGIHCSTAGSLERAALKAHELGANTLQIFSASPRMWRAKAPDPAQVRLMARARERHDLRPLVVHANYLINLAAADEAIREKSVRALQGEIERALIIGAEYLVVHPGNYKDLTPEQGILNVAMSLALAWRAVDDAVLTDQPFTLLLENTAGAGAQLGGRLDELATVRQLAMPYLDIPIGYCLDTCHCYVAGFDIAAPTGLDALVAQVSTELGWEHIPVIHTNDAKTALGSHVDRHANIGAGHIGLEGFRRILNHPELRQKAFILETPVDEPGDDLRNVIALKSLVSTKPGKRGV